MELKKFYADNMQDALKQIKNDIGPDAVIISSKMVPAKKGLKGLFSKKMIEVVASFDNSRSKAMPVPSKSSVMHAENTFRQELINKKMVMNDALEKRLEKNDVKIEGLEDSLDKLQGVLSKFAEKVGYYNNEVEPRYSPEVMDLYRRLMDQDAEKELVQEICAKVEEITIRRGAPVQDVAASVLEEVLGEPHCLQHTKFQRKVAMLVGPTGVGKTTTLVKLVSKMVCQQKLKVGIINTDVYRVAAQEHLKAYCEILNINMVTIYKPEELPEALASMKDFDFVFVDTAGKVADNIEYQEEVKSMLATGCIDDVFLTISASTSNKVIRSIIESYAYLQRYSIIVTKTDEIHTKGVLLYIAKVSGQQLSYITTGQVVPFDISELNPESAVRSMLES